MASKLDWAIRGERGRKRGRGRDKKETTKKEQGSRESKVAMVGFYRNNKLGEGKPRELEKLRVEAG